MKLPRSIAKDRKNTSELATYLASFSVTYLATSLNLALLNARLFMVRSKIVYFCLHNCRSRLLPVANYDHKEMYLLL